MSNKIYDCAIIGGGVAGLTLSIQMANLGYKTILFEKNKYPFHKVCGEYVSNECYDFLKRLGIKLDEMNLPFIDEVKITSPKGYFFHEKLDLGGFGISRYKLDYELFKKALESGVEVFDGTKVNDVEKNDNYKITTKEDIFYSKIVCGSFGKHAQTFLKSKNEGVFLAVKYHIKTDFPNNLVELNNFYNGYCGISKIENDEYCMCYLTTVENLKNSNNNIKEMEKNILYKNKNLKKYFNESEFLYDKPVTISQIYFGKRKTSSSNIILLGDSAGTIAPLFGNGMSIAMRGSFELSKILDKYLKNIISFKQLEDEYESIFNNMFLSRINRSIFLQKIFGKKYMTDLIIGFLSKNSYITKKLIAKSHGDIF